MDAPVDQYIGIDTSKDRLDVHVHPAGEHFAVARDPAGLAELVRRLSALAPKIVAIEATGGYERAPVAALGAAGLPVCVVNATPGACLRRRARRSAPRPIRSMLR